MHYMHIFRVFKNFSFSPLISKYPIKTVVNQPKILFSGTRFPIDIIRNLNKDVLLYTLERSKFYKYLSIFGLAQFTVWSYYAGLMYMSMRNVSEEDLQKYEFYNKSPIWKYALGGNKPMFHAIAFCVVLGVLSATVCTVLPCRIVKELILLKGGKSVSLVTYGPFGNLLKREISLSNMSCVTARSEAKAYLAVKIKPKWFYYLIDIRGKFHDRKLFDYTIGTRMSKTY